MSKHEKKSITDLISSKSQPRKPSAEEIDVITSKIHEKQSSSQALAMSPKGKIKRISLNAPVPLYLKAMTKSTLQDQTLMAYVLQLIEDDVKTLAAAY